jgi:hypothetical protein
MDNSIKLLLGYNSDTPDDEVRKDWDRRTKNICKPCWELKYCPYGSLVENFPLLPITRDEAKTHNEFLRQQLDNKAYDTEKTKVFENQVAEFNPEDYPEKIDPSDKEKSCEIFGHLCPVFFVNEPFTETKDLRRIGRYIPRSVLLRIVRRDNYLCQICGRHLRDDEIEFDHIIPISKGGSTEEQNLRLTCIECNRKRGNRFIT